MIYATVEIFYSKQRCPYWACVYLPLYLAVPHPMLTPSVCSCSFKPIRIMTVTAAIQHVEGRKNRCCVIWSVLVCCVTATSPTSHLVITVLCNSISCLPLGRIKCQQRHKKLKRRQSAALPLWDTSVRLAMYESIPASSPSSYDANIPRWLHHFPGTNDRQPVTQQIEGDGPREHVLWQRCIFPFTYENIDINWPCIHFWIIGTI